VKKNSFGCTSIALLFMLGMGIVWLVFTLNGMKLASESQAWPSTTGVIEDSWIDRDVTTDSDGDTEIRFKPFIKYSYQVNGATYTSQRVDFGGNKSYNSSSRAEDYLAQYPVGKQIEVFYDPEDVGEAVLVREASGATWSIIGSIAFIVIAIVSWVGALIKRNRGAVMMI
jgi:hypothetical protein